MKAERFSKVGRRMWGDERFRALSEAPPNGQTLWFRLLTGPELTCIPGLFPAWEAGLAQALRWPLKGFRDAFAEVLREGMAEADWNVGLVWVPNAIEHNVPESPNVVLSWRTPWAELPECELKNRAYTRLRTFLEWYRKPFAEAFDKAIPNPFGKASPNQEQEQDLDLFSSIRKRSSPDPDSSVQLVAKDLSGSAREQKQDPVFAYWVEKLWRKVNPDSKRVATETPKRLSPIRARRREGFTDEQLCRVIDRVANSAFHLGQNDTGKPYIEPETIFRNREKVDGWLAKAAPVARSNPRALHPNDADAPDPFAAARAAAGGDPLADNEPDPWGLNGSTDAKT